MFDALTMRENLQKFEKEFLSSDAEIWEELKFQPYKFVFEHGGRNSLQKRAMCAAMFPAKEFDVESKINFIEEIKKLHVSKEVISFGVTIVLETMKNFALLEVNYPEFAQLEKEVHKLGLKTYEMNTYMYLLLKLMLVGSEEDRQNIYNVYFSYPWINRSDYDDLEGYSLGRIFFQNFMVCKDVPDEWKSKACRYIQDLIEREESADTKKAKFDSFLHTAVVTASDILEKNEAAIKENKPIVPLILMEEFLIFLFKQPRYRDNIPYLGFSGRNLIFSQGSEALKKAYLMANIYFMYPKVEIPTKCKKESILFCLQFPQYAPSSEWITVFQERIIEIDKEQEKERQSEEERKAMLIKVETEEEKKIKELIQKIQ